MCWHKWSKWEVVNDGALLIGERIIGKYLIQKRVCEKCNKTEMDKQESYI